jgi:hypothetical protein
MSKGFTIRGANGKIPQNKKAAEWLLSFGFYSFDLRLVQYGGLPQTDQEPTECGRSMSLTVCGYRAVYY